MKIVFLCRLFAPHIGGVEKHVMQISKRLQEQGHDVVVITEQYQPSLPLHDTVEGIDVYRINKKKDDWFQKFRLWHGMWRLRSVLKSADIIHCHDVFFWYLPFRFLFPNKPVYTTFHGYEGFPIQKKAIFMRKISEKLSWGNICIGDFIPKWYGTKATAVSYGAAEEAFVSTEKRVKKESAVFFGRLDDLTGIRTYVNAYKLLKKEYPKFELLVIGDGEDKRILSKDIQHIGFQKYPETYLVVYHFVFVSGYLSILEALLAKRLVIAVYDNPMKEDYLKLAPFAKFIVIEKDPEKVAEQVAYYLNHPEEEKKLVDSGYQWAKKQTWKKMVDLYLSVWEIKK